MAKALCNQEKFPDSKWCLDIACGILDKKEDAFSVEVAEAYMEISMQYETMNEFETAITLLKRSQSMLEKLPQEQHSEGKCFCTYWLVTSVNGQGAAGYSLLGECSGKVERVLWFQALWGGLYL